mmetsp:Transcript_24366/g.54945  ORF Transcript_24366/g.54945 Transcript_24366/m.54945 type:complete len:401 (+) Transcript_24366:167-1369(+)
MSAQNGRTLGFDEDDAYSLTSSPRSTTSRDTTYFSAGSVDADETYDADPDLVSESGDEKVEHNEDSDWTMKTAGAAHSFHGNQYATMSSVVSRMALNARYQVIPTLAELRKADSVSALSKVYAKASMCLVLVGSAIFGVLVLIASAAVMPPAVAMTAAFLVALFSPLVVVAFICLGFEFFFPRASRWAELAVVTFFYPVTPAFTIGLCFCLVALCAAFPLIYMFSFTALVGYLVLGTHSFSPYFAIGIVLASLPSILPNFFFAWFLAVPSCLLTTWIWIPAVCVETWLFVFPSFVVFLLLRGGAATKLFGSTVDSATQFTSHLLNLIFEHLDHTKKRSAFSEDSLTPGRISVSGLIAYSGAARVLGVKVEAGHDTIPKNGIPLEAASAANVDSETMQANN